MPAGAVYVGRPTKWGNPHRIINTDTGQLDHGESVSVYLCDLLDGNLPITAEDARRELRGKDLVCWCKEGEPCHADVLLKIANEVTP